MVFFSLILFIGVLTTFTDLQSKKIYNQHLAIVAVLGLIATAYNAVFLHADIVFQLTNGLVAFLIGFVLHRAELWRGGDAKLFALYAFLMPPPISKPILFHSAISLFACSFIAGTIILLPVFIKDIIVNRKTIITDLCSPIKGQAIFNGVGMAILYSWLFFPLFYFARLTSPIFNLTFMFLIFSSKYNPMRDVKSHLVIRFIKKHYPKIFICVVFGYLFRFLLAPETLTYHALINYIVMIMIYTTVSICIHTTLSHFKDYKERVPFAPLLFLGCLLSYTPFFLWVAHAVRRG